VPWIPLGGGGGRREADKKTAARVPPGRGFCDRVRSTRSIFIESPGKRTIPTKSLAGRDADNHQKGKGANQPNPGVLLKDGHVSNSRFSGRPSDRFKTFWRHGDHRMTSAYAM